MKRFLLSLAAVGMIAATTPALAEPMHHHRHWHAPGEHPRHHQHQRHHRHHPAHPAPRHHHHRARHHHHA